MNENIILQGDAQEMLKSLPDEIADCCVTSPPYYGLRDYGVDGQIGLEQTPEEYINRLVDVFREVRRVLKKDGTLWIVIADSYAGSGKGAANYPDNGLRYKRGTNKGMVGATATTGVKTPGIKPKDLIGIPWMLAFALRQDGWYFRQDIIWQKTNPMPESVKDRCTKSHEYVFLLSKSRNYYFDAEAISEPVADGGKAETNGNIKVNATRYGGKKYTATPDKFYRTKSGNAYMFRPRRNKRDVWTVSTRPYKGAHFATYPPDLIEPCILAGSREGGRVLDPFFGSGTTGLVAVQNGRKYIGIDLNKEYIELAKERIENGVKKNGN